MACQGGWLDVTFSYLENTGVVTEKCFPYVSGAAGQVPHCIHGACVDSSIEYKKYKCAAGSVTSVYQWNDFKEDLATNGPSEVAFTVFRDFMSYKSGVYKPTTSDVAGGHAVKLIGYGNEGGEDYYLCANSWGGAWGDSGTFKIQID